MEPKRSVTRLRKRKSAAYCTSVLIVDRAYVKAYISFMGAPKITKQTDLRENLYKTLEDIAKGGKPHLVPTKQGEVIIISRQEYDSILEEKELLSEFRSPLDLSELSDAGDVFKRLEKKFGSKK